MSRDRLQALRQAQYQNAHELMDLNGGTRTNVTTTQEFLDEATSIQVAIAQITANVTQIATLHARSLDNIDQGGQTHDAAQLDQLTADTRTLSSTIAKRIKALETSAATSGADRQIRKNRAAVVRSNFVNAVQKYQRVEQDHRAKSRQRIERQLKIVKPDATQEEVQAVAEGSGQQIFAQALSQSSRYAESRITFREVQNRQDELKKLEATLAELAQLMIDIGTLVESQQEIIDTVDVTTEQVADDTKKAEEHLWKAVISARHYRKHRWICFGITILILIIIAAAIAGWWCLDSGHTCGKKS